MLIFESTSDESAETNLDIPVSVVHLGPQGAQVLADSSYFLMELIGRSFRVSAGSFFQVNTEMAETRRRLSRPSHFTRDSDSSACSLSVIIG